MRYKQPDATTSQKIEMAVNNQQQSSKSTSDNYRFSAAVAEFGLLLRDSKFKSDATYQQAIALAKQAKGKDQNGYRMELIRMMEAIELLDKEVVAERE